MLGDLGADIIKIEPPEGDTTRYTGPRVSADMASLFMGVNRNKRSIVLDLKTAGRARRAAAAGRQRRRVRPQHPAAEARTSSGSARTTLLARNPRLIYAGIHGWREDGPYSGRPAYDDIIQGLCGVASLMDQLTGEPRYAPTILCRQDQRAGGGAGDPRRALSPREDRPRPVRRNPDVRDHGGVHHGRASARARLRARRGASRAMRACWRPGGGRTAPPTGISACWPIPTRSGGGSGPRSASRR